MCRCSPDLRAKPEPDAHTHAHAYAHTRTFTLTLTHTISPTPCHPHLHPVHPHVHPVTLALAQVGDTLVALNNHPVPPNPTDALNTLHRATLAYGSVVVELARN